MMIRGSVDTVTETEITGWVYSPGRSAPITVQAILNHEILGDTTASTHRPDLKAAGLGDGNSGFEIKLYREIDPLYLPFLRVTVDGGDAEIPRAPTLGFSDFFRALYAAHPTTGRHRSVFGGLWTDRTDAVAMLEGKVAIGQIAPDTAKVVLDLIRNGFATLPLPEEPVEHVWRDSLAKQVAKVLGVPAVLSMLSAVLEDRPMIFEPEWLIGNGARMQQPSMRNTSPSPAECLELIVPFGDETVVDLVRESHLFPEFTQRGSSRWADDSEGIADAAVSGILQSKGLTRGTMCIFGPGTVFRIIPSSSCLRAMCVPTRSIPSTANIEFGRGILKGLV